MPSIKAFFRFLLRQKKVPKTKENGKRDADIVAAVQDPLWIERKALTEKNGVIARDRDNIADGEFWYIINAQWLREWREFAFGKTTRIPGPISNHLLMDSNGSPLPNLERADHYRGVCPEVWTYLYEIYGGGPVLPRAELDIYHGLSLTHHTSQSSWTSPSVGSPSKRTGLSKSSKTRISRITPNVTNSYVDSKDSTPSSVKSFADNVSQSYTVTSSRSSARSSVSRRARIAYESTHEQDTDDDSGSVTESDTTVSALPSNNSYAYRSRVDGGGKGGGSTPLSLYNGYDENPPNRVSSFGSSRSNSSSVSTLSSFSSRRAAYSHGSSSSSTLNQYSLSSSSVVGSRPQLVGLRNIGNTCYMNSCLQCVCTIDTLRNYFLEGRGKDFVHPKAVTRGKLAIAFEDVCRGLWENESEVYVPSALKRAVESYAPMFVGFGQQDCQEFFRYLMDGLHEEMNRGRPVRPRPENAENLSEGEAWSQYQQSNASIVAELFGGQLRSRVHCFSCKRNSDRFDPFLDLSLPIPVKTTKLSVHDCLEAFTEEEILTSNDRYFCERCKKHSKASKCFSLSKLPPVLVLHLKRFRTVGAYSRKKIDRRITFPLEGLDVSSFCGGPSSTPMYDLLAVVQHMGGVDGGHYIAHCKRGNDWFTFSDTHITSTTATEVQNCEAYMLIYKSRI
eukprot:GILJ01006836.1.p1 GENE.GILJ01006836.1~~GILJ01006836.1.p1  ORF type:complete len:675 (+),score=67.35 GILJ01006836.1:65-2089(+)